MTSIQHTQIRITPTPADVSSIPQQTCRLGSCGSDVVVIQKQLSLRKFFSGIADAIFGDITEAAVRLFQKSAGIDADGIVGEDTVAALFPSKPPTVPDNIPPPHIVNDKPKIIVSKPSPKTPTVVSSTDLATRCLALVGTIETSKLPPDCFASIIGNFDGQLVSFGALQWNFGQGTLQPLLKRMFANHPTVMSKIFGDRANTLSSVSKESASTQTSFNRLAAFSRSIQNSRFEILAPWSTMFKTLGLSNEFQDIEVVGASSYYNRATSLCNDYSLRSRRGRALMFDVCVQNGSISTSTKSLILSDFAHISASLSPNDIEAKKMLSIAHRVANNANPKYLADVLSRKLCIATGSGTIHGMKYNLTSQFDLDLSNA